MSLTFRTGDRRYHWLNTVFAVAEGRLDYVTVDGVTTGGVVHGRAYQCVPTFGLDMRVQQEGA